MADITTRIANSADLPQLREFEQGVIDAERPLSSNMIDGELRYYDLEGLLASNDAALVVAESEGELIGSGYARIEIDKPYFKPQRYAYLGFMYVEPKFRGRGVNELVSQALLEWAREQGISAFKLDVYVGNAAAIRAYEKLGFKGEMLEMLKLD